MSGTATTARPRAGKGAKQAKIVVTGPFGAGKTTLIRTMSEVAVLSTERDLSAAPRGDRGGKSSTTVAMDFGRLTIDAELVLYLFGTPGQERFDFMWEILSDGMLGFVVLVDSERDESYGEAADILRFFHRMADVPFVVAVNKVGDTDDGVGTARERLRLPEDARCLPVDARDKESVKSVLLELLYAVLADIEASAAATA